MISLVEVSEISVAAAEVSHRCPLSRLAWAVLQARHRLNPRLLLKTESALLAQKRPLLTNKAARPQ